MRLAPIELIFVSLFIMIGVGIFYNNTSADFGTSTSLTCNPGTQLCYFSNYNGCNPTICTMGNPSFFAQNSPFTYLLQGNILGFASSFASGTQNNPNGFTQFTFCSPTGPSSGLPTSSNAIVSFSCQGSSGVGCLIFPIYNMTSSQGNNSQWTVNGLAYQQNNCNFAQVPVQIAQAVIYGYYVRLNATYDTLTVQSNGNSASVSNSINIPNMFTFVGFLIGIILFIMGLGLTISANAQALATGVGGSVGVDDQGARLAQIIGIGLIVWTFFSSLFGAWLGLNGFISPIGLGLSLIIYIILSAMFFFGTYWQISSWTG